MPCKLPDLTNCVDRSQKLLRLRQQQSLHHRRSDLLRLNDLHRLRDHHGHLRGRRDHRGRHGRLHPLE